jgi:uncharacterized membrane protein
MNSKTYRQIRAAIALFIGTVVGIAVIQNSYTLAIVGVLTGMLFLALVRSKAKIVVDEREATVREKAAQLTYAIFAPTIGIGAFLLLIPSKSGLAIFAHGEFAYLESLGMILAYLSLFMIALYAMSYYFLNRRFGGDSHDE